MLPPRSHRRLLPQSFRLSVFILLSLASLVFFAALTAASPAASPAFAVDARALSNTLSSHARDLLVRDPPGELDGEDPTGGREDEEEKEETKPDPGDPEISEDEVILGTDEPSDSVVAPVGDSVGELITGTGLLATNVTIGEEVHTPEILVDDEDESDSEETVEHEKVNESSISETGEKLNDTDLAVQKDKEESKIETFEDGLNEDSVPDKEPPADADKTSEMDANVGEIEEEASEEMEPKMAAKPPVDLEESDDDTFVSSSDEEPFSDAKSDEAAPPSINTKPIEDLDKPAAKNPSGDLNAELDHPAYEDEAVPEDGTATQESNIDPDSELVVSQEVVYLFLIVLGSVAILAMKGTRAIVVSLFGNVFADKGDYHHLPTHNDGLADTHGIPLTSPRAHPLRASRALNPAPASTAWAVDMSDVIDIPTPRSQPADSLPGSKKGMQLQGRASKPSSGSSSNGATKATTAPPGERGQARGAGAQQGGQRGQQQQVGSSTATADASWDSWKDGDEDW